MLETLTVWDVELTDTFGGEANYSWVRRDQLALPQDASRRQVAGAGRSSTARDSSYGPALAPGFSLQT